MKSYQIFYTIKKTYSVFCLFKTCLISTKGYKNAGVRLIIEKETGIVWVSMKNVKDGLGI